MMKDSEVIQDTITGEYFYGQLLNATPDLVFTFSLRDQRFSYWNFAVARLLDWSEIPLRVSGRGLIRQLIHPESRGTFLRFLEYLRAAEDGETEEAEFRVCGFDQTWHWLRCRGTIFSRTPEGYANEILCTAQDISTRRQLELLMANHAAELQDLTQRLAQQTRQLEKAKSRLETLAVTDSLTNLLNHAAFQERLEDACYRARREDAPLALLLLDVDYFKRINDQFGHPVGDAILRQVAITMAECVRDSDTVARYGGEEFAIALPGAERDAALLVAERIHQAISDLRSIPTAITVSIGIATLGYPSLDRESLIERADDALYTAKNTGRNRTCVA